MGLSHLLYDLRLFTRPPVPCVTPHSHELRRGPRVCPDAALFDFPLIEPAGTVPPFVAPFCCAPFCALPRVLATPDPDGSSSRRALPTHRDRRPDISEHRSGESSPLHLGGAVVSHMDAFSDPSNPSSAHVMSCLINLITWISNFKLEINRDTSTPASCG